MKKSLLFVLPSLRSGGAEKSLVMLLTLIDYSEYDVDLFLFRREGLFLPLVPECLNITDAGDDYLMFDGSASGAILNFLKRGKLLSAIDRVMYAKAQSLSEEDKVSASWKYLSKVLPKRGKEYDAVIGYLEGTATYYAMECVRAKKRIAFLHTDYDRIAFQKKTDEVYYKKADLLVGVSESCTEKALGYFPFLKGKTATLYNIISPAIIRKMSREECDFESGDSTVILTVGRMSPPKGIDTAVSACAILRRKGYNIRWYHIGVGELYEEIKNQIKDLSLQNDFILLKEQSNPYRFMAGCDIYVQPSRFEGKSIAIDEAKALCKPIVVTDFDTVFDQITDSLNGIITQKDPESVAQGVERLLNDESLRNTLSENLKNEKVGNEEDINRFYELLQEKK